MATRYAGTPTEIRVLDAYIKLMRASGSVASRLERRLAPAGLTQGQLGVLEILLHLGPLSQREIAGKLFRSDGNVVMVVDNLERRGLVGRTRDSTDRRRVTVSLTPAGRRLIARVFPDHVATIVEAFSVLRPDEQEELGRLCKRLGLHAAPVTRRAAGRARTGRPASRLPRSGRASARPRRAPPRADTT
jgi:MarR family 2-MHQ and catechol resistance regulon transcriptional repressor